MKDSQLVAFLKSLTVEESEVLADMVAELIAERKARQCRVCGGSGQAVTYGNQYEPDVKPCSACADVPDRER